MKVIILANSFDEFFAEEVKKPKALFDINGKTVLDHLMENIAKVRPESVSILSNNLYYEEFVSWREKRKNAFPVLIENNGANFEGERGVVSDLYDVIRRLDGTYRECLILSTDIWFDYPLNHFFIQALHHMPKPVMACYDVKLVEQAKKLSVIQMDSEFRVFDLNVKPEVPKSTFIDAGIYFFPRSIMFLFYEYLKLQKRSPYKFTDFIKWLFRRQTVVAIPIEGKWMELAEHEGGS